MMEGIAEKVLDNITSTGVVQNNGDYIGEDGMLYCGKCHTRKEREIDWFGQGTRKVPVMCKCQVEEHRLREEQMKREEEMRSIRRAKISSMMDDTFQTATFENFQVRKENENHLKIAKSYCEKFQTMYERNQGLLFYGTVGTGKSYMAACIANYLLEKNTSVVMTSFVRILQEMQGFDREREESFSNRLNNVRLLIIDDLGAERSTDYALEKVYGIIDSRYRAKKPLILTTNLTLQQMQNNTDIRYERIYDRDLRRQERYWRDDMDSKDVGKYIKAIREEKKISQRKLAEMIGRGESTIGNYETGATDIPCSALLDIAQAMEIGPEELFGVKLDKFNPVAELRIYTQEDRQMVSGVLVKNGYTVRQIKVPREKGKSNYLCLQAKLEESSLESQ